jgi:peptide/nickel transport system permease protein
MKPIQFIIIPLLVVLMAAIAATFLLYQLVSLTPGSLPMNAQAKPASYTEWLFGSYSSRGVVNGDFGDSIMQRRSAYEISQQRLPASLEIFIPAAWQSLVLGILLGSLLALLRNWLTDGFLRPFVWLGVSTPVFWLALMLILIFGIQQREFPVSGRCAVGLTDENCPDIEHLILPLRALVFHWTCVIALFIRGELLPFLKKSRVDGFKPRYLVEGLVLPLLMLLPVFFAGLASTQLLIEAIFAWPGIGRLALDAAAARDLPLLTASIVPVVLALIAVFFVTVLLNGFIRLLLAETPKAAPAPQPASDELIIPESTNPFAESENPPLRITLRPFIDKVYTALAIIAALVLLGIVLVSFMPSLVTSADPLQSELSSRLLPPGAEGHAYGTDELGRDVLSRLLSGGRTTLLMAFMAALIALVIGSIAGFVGGLFMQSIGVILNIPINAVMMGISLLPIIPILLLVVGVFQLDQNNLPFFLGLLIWDSVAVVVRTKVAAVMSGQGKKHSLASWLLLVVYALALNMAIAVSLESSLSFLGFGVQPPSASWGAMIASGRNFLANADYLVVLPGLLIVVTILCLNIIASRIHDSPIFASTDTQ